MEPVTISITISCVSLGIVGLYLLRKLYKRVKKSSCITHTETRSYVFDFSYKTKSNNMDLSK